MMTTCHECHASISDKAVTCPRCGCPCPAHERTCPECAKTIAASAVTCPHCGVPLAAATDSAASCAVAVGQLRDTSRKTVDAILAHMGVLQGEQLLLAGQVSAITRSGAVADDVPERRTLVLTTHRLSLANVGILGGVEVTLLIPLEEVHRFDFYPSEAAIQQFSHLYIRKRGDHSLLMLFAFAGNDLLGHLAGLQQLFQGKVRPPVVVHQPTVAGVRS